MALKDGQKPSESLSAAEIRRRYQQAERNNEQQVNARGIRPQVPLRVGGERLRKGIGMGQRRARGGIVPGDAETAKNVQNDINGIVGELYDLAGSLQDNLSTITNLSMVGKPGYEQASEQVFATLNGLNNIVNLLPEIWSEITSDHADLTGDEWGWWYRNTWAEKSGTIKDICVTRCTWWDLFRAFLGLY